MRCPDGSGKADQAFTLPEAPKDMVNIRRRPAVRAEPWARPALCRLTALAALSAFGRTGQHVFLDVHGMNVGGIGKVVIAPETGSVDAGDGSEVVHLVHVAGHADRTDHLALPVADELPATFEKHRALGEALQVLHEDRLLARLLQHQPRGAAERE